MFPELFRIITSSGRLFREDGPVQEIDCSEQNLRTDCHEL